MKKPSIPSPYLAKDPEAARVMAAIKNNVDIVTGAIGGELVQLDATTATLADVVGTVNAIIRRMNRSGS